MAGERVLVSRPKRAWAGLTHLRVQSPVSPAIDTAHVTTVDETLQWQHPFYVRPTGPEPRALGFRVLPDMGHQRVTHDGNIPFGDPT